jgi:hypothetical protein
MDNPLIIIVRARSAPLERSTLVLEPARLRWTGDASLGRTTNAVALNTQTNILVHIMHGSALVFIDIHGDPLPISMNIY